MKRSVYRFCLTAIVVSLVAMPVTSAWGDTQTITAPYSGDYEDGDASADRQTGNMRATAIGWTNICNSAWSDATIVATHNLDSEAKQVNYTANVHINSAQALDGGAGLWVVARHATCESCWGSGLIWPELADNPRDYSTTVALKNSDGSSVPAGQIEVSVELEVIAWGRSIERQFFCVPLTPGYASAAGTLTSIVAVTDPSPAPTPSATATPVPTPSPAGIHVHDLDGSATDLREGSWVGSVRIHVTDQNESPVAGAAVSGTWSSGSAGGNCTTNDSGWCEVTSSTFRKSDVKSVTYSVDGVSAPSPYNSSANHDGDGDSDGTTITVNKQN